MKIVDANHIPDATKMVATLQSELAESKAMIERLQADNQMVTEWFRRLEDAGDAMKTHLVNLYNSGGEGLIDLDAIDGWEKAKEAKP